MKKKLFLPLCLCWDKDHHHVQEAKDHHLLSNPCFEFFLQLPYYGVASMATIFTILQGYYRQKAK